MQNYIFLIKVCYLCISTNTQTLMRKKKREMSAEFAFGVFDKAPYATLSMVLPDGNAYGIPVSQGRDGEVFFAYNGSPHRPHPTTDGQAQTVWT